MKFLVILPCLLVVAYGLPPEVVEMIKQTMITYAGECKGELGTSDEDVAPLMAHEAPKTPKGKCFVACMHKKFGFQDASGKIDKAASYGIVEKLKPIDADCYEKLKKVTDICMAEVTDAADECETAFNMYNCVQREKLLLAFQILISKRNFLI